MKPLNSISKSFLIFLFLLSFIFYPLSFIHAQAPHKFNYQAVARNGSAVLESETINVKFEILQGSPSGSLVWTEMHMNVTTSPLGLFSLEVGDVVALVVNWTDGPYYLDVELDLIDGNGFRDFGNAELLSVPYAMFAETANGPWSVEGLLGDTLLFPGSVAIGPTLANGSKLAVQGDNLLTEDALFEVKRQDGQTVFAVYNDSIRMFVDDSPGKGSKGGFAIGGFTPGKGLTNDYFMVSPDSVRVYIDHTQTTKGSKGGFAIGGFTPGKGPVEDLMYLGRDNYFIGHQAGANNTEGIFNTFFGYQAGRANTTGRDNIFIGNLAGTSNIGAIENIFIGNKSGFNTRGGYGNVYVGNESGYENISGYYNSFVGYRSGYNNASHWNSFFGYYSGYSNTTGQNNTFAGNHSGYYSKTGSNNTAIGKRAGYSVLNASGYDNVSIGVDAGYGINTGHDNISIGNLAGYSNATGNYNVFVGTEAGRLNSDGQYNSFIGYQAGYSNISGDYNTIFGYQSGFSLTGGSESWEGAYNTLLGYQAGYSITTGYKNVAIGYRAGYGLTDNRYNVLIGEQAGQSLSAGQGNIMLGLFAGTDLVNGEGNVFIGLDAAYVNSSGSDNVWIGLAAGRAATGSGNVFLGKYAGYGQQGDNQLVIENNYTGTDNANNALIYGDFSSNQLKFNSDLNVTGDINFGDTSPQGKFNIGGIGGIQGVMVVNRFADDGILIRFRRDGGTVGEITVASGTVSYGAFTGSHYAWTDDELDKGILVTMSGDNKHLENNPDSEIMYGVKESNTANDSKILGAYLSVQSPGSSPSVDNPHMIMAVGNGTMWVADKGEDLNIGDYLISADISGHAMKDIGSFDISYIIGRVAEPVEWSNVTKTIDGIKHKQVSVFFESFEKDHRAEKLTETFNMALMEQQKQIEELKVENAELAAKINNTSKLEAELAELKALVEQISLQQALYTQKEDQ